MCLFVLDHENGVVNGKVRTTLDAEAHHRLKAIAKERGTSVREVVNSLVGSGRS